MDNNGGKMQVLKEAIRNKILQAAEEVFYAKDYRSARLVDIAKKAGVPVALIYTYFKNKEELFGEIVMTIYAKIIRNINEMEYVGEMGSDNFNRIGKLQMSELLLEHKKLVILMDKAAGTKFVDSRVDITKRLQKTIKKKIEGYSENKYDESLYYLISCTFIEGVLEIARGYKNAKWAKNMMSLLMQCHFLGVPSL